MPETTPPTTDTTTTETTTPASTEPTESEPHAGSEAAKYRVRAKEAEQQRDTLAARLEGLQRAELLRQVGSDLEDPADLLVGRSVAELLDDDGEVDTEKVTAALAETLAEHPHWAAGYSEAQRDGVRRQPKNLQTHYAPRGSLLEGKPSWTDVLQGKSE